MNITTRKRLQKSFKIIKYYLQFNSSKVLKLKFNIYLYV